MSILIHEEDNENVIEVQVGDKLTAQDYDHFVPTIEKIIRQFGKVRILFEMKDFHGWHAGALWEDIKFDIKHFRDIEKLAMVGDTKWEKGMSVFCKPFTTAQIRFFPEDKIQEAKTWLHES